MYHDTQCLSSGSLVFAHLGSIKVITWLTDTKYSPLLQLYYSTFTIS